MIGLCNIIFLSVSASFVLYGMILSARKGEGFLCSVKFVSSMESLIFGVEMFWYFFLIISRRSLNAV